MSSVKEKSLETTGFGGEVIRPGDDGYDQARAVWNGLIDRRPDLIARCSGTADVVDALNFARENDLAVAVRGGGHSVSGHGVCDGGIVIDLSPMKGVWVDRKNYTAQAQAGLTWGEFYRETQAFGLATAGGPLPGTGIAGLTLGGGIGFLTRKYGLTIDNLLSAEVVTAEGETLTANEEENPDLFWAIRGGGGNFGIVTSFEYRLHEVGPIVMGGMAMYPATEEVLRFYREFTQQAPEELTTIAILLGAAPPEPFVPQEVVGEPVVLVFCCYAGSLEDGEEAVRPLKESGPAPLADMLSPLPFTTLVGLGADAAPPSLRNRWRSHYLSGLEDGAIETIVEHGTGVTSPRSHVMLYHLGGEIGRASKDETAFAHREAPYNFVAAAMWEDPAEDEENIRWAQEFWEAMRPFSTGGVYVNFLDEGEGERVKGEAYGSETHARLSSLKGTYDPGNLFRINHNVRPSR